MGTSATITFSSQEEGTTKVYENFDGYPQGMAEKMAAFMDNPTRGFAARYIRANDRAELAGGFIPGGDYTYNVWRERGETRISATDQKTGRVIFLGTMSEFLSEYDSETA